MDGFTLACKRITFLSPLQSFFLFSLFIFLSFYLFHAFSGNQISMSKKKIESIQLAIEVQDNSFLILVSKTGSILICKNPHFNGHILNISFVSVLSFCNFTYRLSQVSFSFRLCCVSGCLILYKDYSMPVCVHSCIVP